MASLRNRDAQRAPRGRRKEESSPAPPTSPGILGEEADGKDVPLISEEKDFSYSS